MRVLRSVVALGLFAGLARTAVSQEPYATAEVRGGFSVTNGSTKDLLKGQSSFGVGAAIALGKKAHLGLTADWAHHSERFVCVPNPLTLKCDIQNPTSPTVCQAPAVVTSCDVIGGAADRQLNVVHAFVKFSYTLLDESKVTVDLNAGPGLMIFSPNQVVKDATGYQSETHLALNGGATVTWWFSDRIGLLVSPQVDYALKKTTGNFFFDANGNAKGAMIFPMTGGFRFKL
jgi:hypothetical protein